MTNSLLKMTSKYMEIIILLLPQVGRYFDTFLNLFRVDMD